MVPTTRERRVWPGNNPAASIRFRPIQDHRTWISGRHPCDTGSVQSPPVCKWEVLCDVSHKSSFLRGQESTVFGKGMPAFPWDFWVPAYAGKTMPMPCPTKPIKPATLHTPCTPDPDDCKVFLVGKPHCEARHTSSFLRKQESIRRCWQDCRGFLPRPD